MLWEAFRASQAGLKSISLVTKWDGRSQTPTAHIALFTEISAPVMLDLMAAPTAFIWNSARGCGSPDSCPAAVWYPAGAGVLVHLQCGCCVVQTGMEGLWRWLFSLAFGLVFPSLSSNPHVLCTPSDWRSLQVRAELLEASKHQMICVTLWQDNGLFCALVNLNTWTWLWFASMWCFPLMFNNKL